ncbi:MAG: type III-B CRISPR module-associated Cmr3 family protein [Candidatus Solibacter sp.]
MKAFSIEPVDTWFFRDGTPYSIEIGSQLDVGGAFPPSPSSVAGALRATLAAAHGWNGVGPWPVEFNNTLGNGPNDLGHLRLQGPFVLQNEELLLPAPRHLWTREVERVPESRFARIGSGVLCDLGGDVLLPSAVDGAKPVSKAWVRKSAFEDILNGALPDKLIPEADLWCEESRTGIQRNPATRTVGENGLYSSRHFRLQKGTALMMSATGLPPDWPLPSGAYPFGGESRLAYWQQWSGDLALKMPIDRICEEGRFILIALTPLDLNHQLCLGRTPLTDLGGALVKSACMDRPIRIGGWDSLSRQPRPMRSYVPPGTVFFCECQDKTALRSAIDQMGDRMPVVGETSDAGFGCVALGMWIETKEPA